jgi:hypothetical protein
VVASAMNALAIGKISMVSIISNLTIFKFLGNIIFLIWGAVVKARMSVDGELI